MQDQADWTARLRLTEACRTPRHFYVDIGNLCNLRCPFCVTGAKESTLEQGFMTFARFAILFEKIRHSAALISLYNWGEPLMNKELLPIIELAGSEQAKVHIDTNLSVHDFTDDYCRALVRSGLYSIFASIDGVTQQVYQIYRVRGRLHRIFGNLERLQRVKAEMGSPFPIIGWQFHVSAHNEHEIPDAIAMAERLGIGIVFKRLNSPDPSWWSSLHEQSLMVLKGADWFNRTYAPPLNPDLEAILLHPAVASPCSQLFATMTIAWNGDVMPCTCVEGPDFTMGNLFRQTLDQVWNGPAFRQSRQFILNYGPRQGGQSVCERLSCPIVEKHVSAT